MVVKVGEAVERDLRLMQQGVQSTVRKGFGKAECVEVLDPGGSSIKPGPELPVGTDLLHAAASL